MATLLWIIAIILGIRLVFRLFGKQILNLGMQQIAKRLMKDAEAQSQAFQRNYQGFEKAPPVYVDNEVKVSPPPKAADRPVREDDIAEDVDFEEVK
jgi:hypothetical protein